MSIRGTLPSGGAGGGGAVTSVATRTGDVVLTAADVAAGTFPGAMTFGAGFRLGTQTISTTATLVTGSASAVLADTTSAAFTITLPATPAAGAVYIFVDSAGQWSTNNLTIALNGKNLNGAGTNPVVTQLNGTFGIYYDGTAWHSIVHAPSDLTPTMDGTGAAGTAFGYSRRDHVHPSDTSRAPLASPTFTGTVTLPEGNDAAAGTASRRTLGTGATQAMQGSLAAPLASPTFTGTPAVPTAAADTNTTQAASTANVVATAAQKSTLTTKGDIYAASAASTPARLPIGSAGQRIMVDSTTATGLKWVPHIITRTTDATAITANTTLASDDTLLWAMAANEVWYFMLNVKANTANLTMDLKVGMTGPASATAQWGAVGNASSTVAGWGAAAAGGTPSVSGIGGTVSVGGANNADFVVGFAGLVINSSTSGNLNIQFAQNTSDPGNLTIKAYTHLILWRLA